MSETYIGELLVGQPIRDCHGITCCPAICEKDGKQFYIKTIRIPASAVQASGLLLSGAYENAAQIQEYYQSVSDELCKEAELMKQLQNSGFLAYDEWTLTPVENGVGFTLSLQAPCYQAIIGRQWTGLDAINMGLDLCNALSACRQKGYLYANLKPENVFADENGNFCIGDLGMLPIASLQYTSLPEKYRSSYTAPEIADIYATVSTNPDVYALGLMLYQIFNNGELPAGDMIPPVNADYALWQIIATACHVDPLQRYEDPAQLGKALIDYMQHVGITEELLGVTQAATEESEQDDTLFLSDAENDAMLAELLAAIPEETAPAENLDDWISEDAEESDMETEQMLAQADDLISHQLPQPVVAPAVIDVQLPQFIEPEIQEEELAPVDIAEEEPTPDEMPALMESVENPEAEEETEVIAEEPVMPDESAELIEQEEEEEIWDAPKKVNVKKILVTLTVISLVLALLVGGAAVFYNFVYTKTIEDISLTVHSDGVTVVIQSEVADDQLTVVCSNSYGHTVRAAVENGQATVSGLNANTTYTLTVEISGFHQLVGDTSEIFTTPDNIHVSSFTAVTDVWQGSVLLSVTATGNDRWTVRYSAEGEEEKTVSFTGATISISNLTVGKEYTFVLEAQNGAPILGAYQATHVVR